VSLLSSSDEPHLRRALRLAARGRFGVSPNPMVGAVLVRDGVVVGEGWHRRVGGPHAEREALAVAGEAARGATLYLNLEPCSHFGRTPPCADAVIAAGVARVVACHGDPDPRVSGQGFARLRAAGIAVEAGFLVREAVRLNYRFLIAAVERRPAVTLKWAMSLDGRIATAAGESQWITSPAARKWALELREEHDAILVGSGTVLADDPRLTRRLPGGKRRASGAPKPPIVRVVLDRRLRTPPTARLFQEPGEVLIYTRKTANGGKEAARLAAAGATVVPLETPEPAAVLADLQERGVRSVLVEGGGAIHAAFVAAGLYDRVAAACAPLLLGGRAAPGPLGDPGAPSLGLAPRLTDPEAGRRGPDWILAAYRPGCLDALCAAAAG
jgi:diaminohydroxyphosphoribosylaminopyrimidine deaminase/5-amino-6-(5-phosphoribosylamino)uracil reductase